MPSYNYVNKDKNQIEFIVKLSEFVSFLCRKRRSRIKSFTFIGAFSLLSFQFSSFFYRRARGFFRPIFIYYFFFSIIFLCVAGIVTCANQ